nr:reverse transcriptase domain-containing protein [Tanacetum cinerariifolium]
MTWATLKKKMTGKYCPRGEIKKIETEMWNLKVKGNDVVAYNRRFQQLALMCTRMFPEEVDKIEKYIGGLPDMILGSVKASRSKTMQEVIEFTTELMEDKTRAYAERFVIVRNEDNEMLVPHFDLPVTQGPEPMEVVDDPPAARFTWTIENFSTLTGKKLYSDVFAVGGYM